MPFPGLGWLFPVSTYQSSKANHNIEKLFLFWIPMNAKLESANSFRLNNSKITVCTKLSIHTVILVIILPRDLAPLFKRPNLEEDPLLTYLLYVIFSFDISTG